MSDQEEVTGVVVNYDYVTNNGLRINAALSAGQHVEYVTRHHARQIALRTGRPEWHALAKASAIFLIVEGIRYRRSRIESSIGFPLFTPNTTSVAEGHAAGAERS